MNLTREQLDSIPSSTSCPGSWLAKHGARIWAELTTSHPKGKELYINAVAAAMPSLSHYAQPELYLRLVLRAKELEHTLHTPDLPPPFTRVGARFQRITL